MTDPEALIQAHKQVERRLESVNELLEAVQWAYRKHHLGDPSIGWDELSDKLLDALCNAMTAQGYLEWVKPYSAQDD